MTTPETTQQRPAEQKNKAFFGHPWGLANLFGVEMWERFSFYGMQAILIYYLWYSTSDGGLGMSETLAASIVGAYGGAVYICAVGGAWVADRILGAERTLYYSAILIMLGHILLALLPGYAGLIAGLVCVAVGSGGLKTTAGTVLGTLYSPEDPRRDSGFSIFYMGVNIGAFLGPLLTGALQQHYGFHVGFGAAAVGMFIGLIQYTLGRKNNQTPASEFVSNPLPKEGALRTLFLVLLGIAALASLFFFGVIPLERIAPFFAIFAALAAVLIWLQMYRSDLITPEEHNRLLGFLPLFLGNIVFWMIYQQIFTVIAIYSKQRLNRTIFGFEIPPSWIQSIPALFVILLAAFMASLWLKLGDRQPSSPLKFALGLIIIGLGVIPLLLSSGSAPNPTSPFIVIVVAMLIFTIAELFISPIGLSLTTKVAPAAFRNRMMALYFMSVSMGTSLAGYSAGFYSPASPVTERSYFGAMILIPVAAGLIILSLTPWVRRKFGSIK